jgi:hypothetical protein
MLTVFLKGTVSYFLDGCYAQAYKSYFWISHWTFHICRFLLRHRSASSTKKKRDMKATINFLVCIIKQRLQRIRSSKNKRAKDQIWGGIVPFFQSSSVTSLTWYIQGVSTTSHDICVGVRGHCLDADAQLIWRKKISFSCTPYLSLDLETGSKWSFLPSNGPSARR